MSAYWYLRDLSTDEDTYLMPAFEEPLELCFVYYVRGW